MNRLLKLLLALAVGLLVAGIGLAVAQPGSLGGDDEDDSAAPAATDPGDEDPAAAPDEGDDDPTVAPTSSTPARPEAPPTTGSADPAPTTTPDAAPTTTAAPEGSGSGLGSDGSGDEVDSDDLANTGGRSLVLLGLALGGIGLAVRRRTVA